VHVQGAPGAGKTEFLRRCMHHVETDRELLGAEIAADYLSHAAWFHAGASARHTHPLAGLVSAIARAGGAGPAVVERAREVSLLLGRLRFDGTLPDGPVGGLNPADPDPVDRLRRLFPAFVDSVRASPRGRLLVLVAGLDAVHAPQRLAFLEGLRVLASSAPEALFVVGLGREAAHAAVRAREGEVPEPVITRILDDFCDLSVNVPKLEVRRIGPLLRRMLGSGEPAVRRAFGEQSIEVLSAACGHRMLGGPRLLERLASRASLLAEFAVEARMVRELGEAEWAWVVLSERWSDFRRFMIRGGKDRWLQLKHAVGAIGAGSDGPPNSPDIAAWLRNDLLLADYLRLYARAFENDLQSIYWIDDVMLRAGL
jgi:hypothetical protein